LRRPFVPVLAYSLVGSLFPLAVSRLRYARAIRQTGGTVQKAPENQIRVEVLPFETRPVAGSTTVTFRARLVSAGRFITSSTRVSSSKIIRDPWALSPLLQLCLKTQLAHRRRFCRVPNPRSCSLTDDYRLPQVMPRFLDTMLRSNSCCRLTRYHDKIEKTITNPARAGNSGARIYRRDVRAVGLCAIANHPPARIIVVAERVTPGAK